MTKAGFAATLLLLLAGGAWAADDPRVAGLAAANTVLAAEYKTIMAEQTAPGEKIALRDLEHNWIAYRDKECLFEAGGGPAPRPGMAVWSNYADCELRVTKARTTELKGMGCAGVSVCALHSRYET